MTNAESAASANLTVVYTRQSRSSGSHFSSCDAQYAICADTAASMGFAVHDHFRDEGESSETLQRPALEELIRAIRERLIQRVVVYSVDRLARRLALLSEMLSLMEEFGVQLIVVTDPNFGTDAASRLATNIIAAASEFQQDLNRDRLAEMRAAFKSHGKRVAGQIPFGYTTAQGTTKLVPHAEHSVVMRDLFRLAADGAKPNDIATIANLNDWPDRNDNTKRWTPNRILKLLSNRTYLGEIPNGDSTLPGEHAALIDRQVFERVQQHIDLRRTREPTAATRRSQSPHGRLLRGILICGLCDRPMTSSYSQRGPVRYVYYRCRSQAGGRPPCANVSVGQYQLEQFIVDMLEESERDDPDFMTGLHDVWRRLNRNEKRQLLPRLLTRVVFNPDLGTVEIQCDEEVVQALIKDSPRLPD